MAKDMMGELGLDVADIKKALGEVVAKLDGLTQAVDRTDKKVKGGFVNGLKDAAKALGLAFGAASIARYIYGLKTLGSELDTMRAKMIGGGNDKSDGGPAVFFQRAGVEIDRFKVKAKLAVAQTIQGFRLMGEDAGNATFRGFHALITPKGGHANIADERSVHQQIQADIKTDQLKKDLLNHEDSIARIQSESLNTQQARLGLIEEELRLQQEKLALINRDPSVVDDPRGAKNAALQQIGALKAEREAVAYATEKELRAARAVTQETVLQLKGLSGAAKETEIRAKFEAQILQAQRDGKTALAAQLTLQKNLALQQLGVGEHNMSNADRRTERTAARKYARDVTKTTRHEGDLASRLRQAEQQGSPITPGSELDRFRSRRNAQRAANGGAAQPPAGEMGPVVNAIAANGTILTNIYNSISGITKRK